MSGIDTLVADPTELRLDYKDILAGRLVIVIDGLPADGHEVLTHTAHRPSTGPQLDASRTRADSSLVEEAAAVFGRLLTRPRCSRRCCWPHGEAGRLLPPSWPSQRSSRQLRATRSERARSPTTRMLCCTTA